MKAITLTLLLVINPFYCFAQQYQLSKPLMRIEGGNLFRKSTTVRMEFRLEGAHIHYTLDGTEPTTESKKYRRPIKVKSNSVIKARVFKEGFTPSETLESHVFKLGDPIQSIEISPQPPEAYAGDGSATLIDQQAGSTNFRDGKWLGYNKGPVVVILDLGKHKTVEEIIISSLSSPGSWIMNPSLIQSFFSHDGIHFQNCLLYTSREKVFQQVNSQKLSGRMLQQQVLRIIVVLVCKNSDKHSLQFPGYKLSSPITNGLHSSSLLKHAIYISYWMQFKKMNYLRF